MSHSEQPSMQSTKQSGRRHSFSDSLPHNGGLGSSVSPDISSSPARHGLKRNGSSFDIRHDRRGEEKVVVDDSNWFDVPLAFAIIPAIGSLFTGSDVLKDFLLLAFLLYYLHHLIKAPWTLYTSARARRTHVSYADIRNNPANDEHLRRLAGTELRLAELTYLAFTVIAPFLGAILLRSVSKLLSMDVVSTFSTSLFVMATGIRPWRHLIDLLRQRAEALHDVVHVPSEESVRSRVETIEEHLRDIQSVLQDRSGETDMLEAANASLELARKELRKVEKNAEATRIANDARLKALEMAVEALQNTPVHPPLHTFAPIHNGTTVAFTIPQSLADIVIRPFDRLSAFASPPKRRYGNMRNEKTPLTRAEIVEVDDDDDDAGFGESEYEEDRKAPSTKGSGKRVSFAVIERDQDQQPEDMPFFVWVIERLTWIALYPFRWIRALATLFLSIPLE